MLKTKQIMKGMQQTGENEYKVMHEDIPENPDGESMKKADRTAESIEKFIAESVRGGLWKYRKFRSIPLSDKERMIKYGVNGTLAVLFAVVIQQTMSGADFRKLFIMYFILAIAFYNIDPFEIFSRWFALQTRVITSGNALMWFMYWITGNKSMIKAAVITGIVSGFVCYFMNARWILGKRWLYRDEITTAVRQLADKAEEAWKADGKSESRSMLYELGFYKLNDDILDIFVKPVFLLAYLKGTKDIAEKMQVMKNQHEALNEQCNELNEECTNLFNLLAAEQSRTAELERLLEQIELQTAEIPEEITKEPAAVAEVFEDEAEPAAVESTESASDPGEPASAGEAAASTEAGKIDQTLMIQVLHAKGMSYRKIAEELGIKKWQVEEAMKKIS